MPAVKPVAKPPVKVAVAPAKAKPIVKKKDEDEAYTTKAAKPNKEKDPN